jgi:DNA-binding SARP family transcriptional activator/tetratricopeptide (TPR) repeat protein
MQDVNTTAVDATARCTLTLVGKPLIRSCAGSEEALSPMQAALLLLVLDSGSIERSHVGRALWPDKEPGLQQSSLRTLIRSVNLRAGCPIFTAGQETLQVVGAVDHDVGVLQGDALALSLESLGGVLLRDLDGPLPDTLLPWLSNVRKRYRHARHASLRAACERAASGETAASLLPMATQLVADEPGDEAAWQLLIRLHGLRGDPKAALADADRCLQALQTFGRKPDESTWQLVALFEQNLPLHRAAARAELAVMAPSRVVGREADLAAIRRQLQRDGVVRLVGESGVGKTQLLGALARESGSSAVLCQAVAGEIEQPYALVARLLHALLDRVVPILPSDIRGELARLVTDFGHRAPARAHAGRLKQAIVSAMRVWAEHGVTLALLDDMQWADPTSAELLDEVTHGATGMCWLLAARPSQQLPPASVTPGAKPGGSPAPYVLRPFDGNALADLLRSMPIVVSDPVDWARALLPHCLGYPLEAIEVLLALRQARGDRVFLDAPPPPPWPIEKSRDRLIATRLRGLPEQQLQLAQLVAMDAELGKSALAHELMGGISEMAWSTLWLHLRESHVLDDRGLVHDSLREPLLALLPEPLKQVLHRRFAQWAAGKGVAAATVAVHWQQARAWPQAALAFEQAAGEAGEVDALAQKARLLDAAARAHERCGASDAGFDCRMRAFDAETEVLPPDQLRSRVADLERRAVSDTQKAQAGRARASLAMYFFDPGAALDAIQGAMLRAAAASDDVNDALRHCRIDLRQLHSQALALQGRAAEALTALASIDDELSATDDDLLRMQLATATCYVHQQLGHFGPARQSCVAALDLARGLRDTKACLCNAGNLAIVTYHSGDFEPLRELLLEAQDWCGELGDDEGVTTINSRLLLGLTQIRLGRYRDALALLEQCMAYARRAEIELLRIQCESALAYALIDLGRPEQARAALSPLSEPRVQGWISRGLAEVSVDRAEGIPVHKKLIAMQNDAATCTVEAQLGLRLSLSLEQPPPQAARACAEVAAEATEGHRYALAQSALLLRSRALRIAGRADEAARAVRQLLDHLAQRAPHFYLATVWWEAWQSFGAAGRHDEALDALKAGHAWIANVADRRVPPEFKQSFLQVNEVNASLLEAAAMQGLR